MDNRPLVMLLTLQFYAPWCRSLKERRSQVLRLLQRLRSSRCNVSAVDSGPQDIHSRFDISIAYLAFDSAQADSIEASLLRFVSDHSQAELMVIIRERL